MRNLMLEVTGVGRDLAAQLTPIAYRAGDVIKLEREVLDTVFFPLSGLVSARTLMEDGRALECSLIGRTSVVGAVATLGLPCVGMRLVCLTDCSGLQLSGSRLREWLRNRPAEEHLMKLFCFSQVGYAVHVGVCNAMHGAEQRVARWLSNASGLLGRPEIALSQEELAISLGVQRSSLSPALQALKADGVIGLSRGRMIVMDEARLRRRACECADRLGEVLHLNGVDRWSVPSGCETPA